MLIKFAKENNNWFPELIMVGKNISLNTKKQLGKAVVESVACYGCEIWLLKTEGQRKLLALEMDYLRRSPRVSRLKKNPIHHH